MSGKLTYADFMEKVFEYQRVINEFNELCSFFSRGFCLDLKYDLDKRSDIDKQQLTQYKNNLMFLVSALQQMQGTEMAKKSIEHELQKIKRELLDRLASDSGLSIEELKSEIKSLE